MRSGWKGMNVFFVAPIVNSSGDRGDILMSWSEKVSDAGEEK
jgi:hypothetical protein